MKKQLILSLIVIFIIRCNGIYSQTGGRSSEVLGTSPGAAAIGEAVNNQGLVTGAATVAIPLFTLKSSSYTLPIVLSYNTSGIIVDQLASNIGMNWWLNAGGVIARAVKGGFADEIYYEFTTEPPLVPFTYQNIGYFYKDDQPGSHILYGMDGLDMAADLFYFNFSGHVGTFTHDMDRNQIITPYRNIEFTWEKDTFPEYHRGFITSFRAHTENGMLYDFEDYEVMRSLVTYNDEDPPPSWISAERYYTCAWYITSIKDVNENELFHFTYTSVPEFTYEDIITRTYAGNKLLDPTCSFMPAAWATERITEEYSVIGEKILQRIDFPGGYVQFNAGFAREDLPGSYAISSIELYTENDELVSGCYLNYDYYISGEGTDDKSKRLRLASIQQYASDGERQAPFILEYETTELPPRNSFEQDWWGYYNANGATTFAPKLYMHPSDGVNAYSLYPKTGVTEYIINGADRSPNPAVMGAGMLKKIYFPLGGYKELFFEPNVYYNSDAGVNRTGPGLRIQKIATNEGSPGEPPIETYYEYVKKDNPSRSSGSIAALPSFAYQAKDDAGVSDLQEFYNNYTIRRSRNMASLGADVSPVMYSDVKVYQPGSGYTWYFYSTAETDPDIPAVYTTINNDFPCNTSWIGEHDNYPFAPNTSKAGRRGLLLKQEVYREDNTLMQELENQYRFVNEATFHEENEEILYGSPLIEYLARKAEYDIINERVLLDNMSEIIYDPDASDYITTTIIYGYDDTKPTPIPRTVSTTKSDGTLVKKEMFYPEDYLGAANPDPLVVDMVQNYHLFTPLIEQISSQEKSGQEYILSGRYMEYRIDIHNNLVLDKTYGLETENPIHEANFIYSAASGTYDSRYYFNAMEYTTYDGKGNLLSSRAPDGRPTSVIFDADKTLPIAKVVNAEVEDIAYTSFENSSEEGGFAFNPAYIVPGGVTGDYCYQLNTGVTKTLDNTKAYRVAVWAKEDGGTGCFYINGVRMNITEPGFNYYETQISSASSVAIYYSSSVKIDEVRVYPLDAYMNTYTYKPLVGVSSINSENNIMKHYTYDKLGRLEKELDHDGNILAQYNYNTIPFFNVYPSFVSVETSGGSQNVEVCAPDNWTAAVQSGDETWISIDKTSGTGQEALQITATGTFYKLGKVLVTYGTEIREVTVEFDGIIPYLDVTPRTASSFVIPETIEYSINSNDSWNISVVSDSHPGDNWYTLSHTSGTGNQVLGITVIGLYEEWEIRELVLSVDGDHSDPVEITLFQCGPVPL